MTLPLFSILIPAYKEKYLTKCLNSIYNQTYPNFEIIVVDDASPEHIEDICKKNPDKRLRYYRNKKNCGAVNVVDNWNICLNYSTGDYCICMGDDDMLASNTLEDYIFMIKKYPKVNLFHSMIKQIDENDNELYITPSRDEHENLYRFMRKRFEHNLQFIGDFCFKTSRLKENGGFYKLPLAWGSDDLTAFYQAKENGVVHINKPNFWYRVNARTISQTGNTKLKIEAINLEYQLYKNLLNSTPPQSSEEIEDYNFLIKNIDKHFSWKKTFTIAIDMSHNPSHFFLWVKLRTKYKLNMIEIFIGYFKSLKFKFL